MRKLWLKKSVFTSFLFLFCGLSTFTFAQSDEGFVEILQAKTLKSDPKNRNIQKLIGDVRLKQNTTILACDSAIINKANNNFSAFGRVYVNQNDSVQSYCDELHYDGKTKKTELIGKVRLIDDEKTLTTEHLWIDRKNNLAYYLTGAKIVEENTIITSVKGYYNTSSKFITFKDSVRIKSKDYNIEADTLIYHSKTKNVKFVGPTDIHSKDGDVYCESGFYNQQTKVAAFVKRAKVQDGNQIMYADSIYNDQNLKFSEAFKDVMVVDTTDKTTITGNYGIFYEESGQSLMTDSAALLQIMNGDTLFMHADTLLALKDSIKDSKIVFAYHNVKFFKSDLRGKCDSMVYAPSDSLIKMYNDPVIWSENNQITGNYIEILTYDNKIHQLFIPKKGFVVSESDSLGAYDQIKGRQMTGYFVDGKMNILDVEGNGETIYYAKQDDGSYIGANEAKCSNLQIKFKDNSVNRIKFYTKPEAIFHPIDKIKLEKMVLENFVWRHKEMPKSKFDIYK